MKSSCLLKNSLITILLAIECAPTKEIVLDLSTATFLPVNVARQACAENDQAFARQITALSAGATETSIPINVLLPEMEYL